jgi:hypothetical protein
MTPASTALPCLAALRSVPEAPKTASEVMRPGFTATKQLPVPQRVAARQRPLSARNNCNEHRSIRGCVSDAGDTPDGAAAQATLREVELLYMASSAYRSILSERRVRRDTRAPLIEVGDSGLWRRQRGRPPTGGTGAPAAARQC